MRQTWAIVAAVALLLAGCDARTPAPAAGGIVSLTPAGTDLLVAMGLGDRVVGVSSYEPNETLRRKLPKVGDYLRVDFERVAELRPAFMVIQGKRDRLPAGTREKCIELGITPIILQIDRMADITAAIKQIGEAVGDKAAADKLVDDFQRRGKTLVDTDPTANGPRPPTLIVFSDSGTNVVGSENFISDALALAGGVNVIKTPGYPTLDAEKMRSLEPTMVFLLLPNAGPDVVARATAALPFDPAKVRIVAITDANVLMPGTAAMTLAETMRANLRVRHERGKRAG